MLVCHHHHVFAEDTGERIRDKIAASKRKGLWMGGYQDGNVARLGIVRSTQVEAGMPEVWQTLGVQSHV